MLAMIGEDATSHAEEKPVIRVKARTITLGQRLMPLFRAAAVVAIFLTLGNAAQRAFEAPANDVSDMAVIEQPTTDNKSVAMGDSLKVDTLQKAQQPEPIIIK